MPICIHYSDDIAKACRLISLSIGHDWTRLYWQLPFYPVRGQEELLNDIQNIHETYRRGDVLQVGREYFFFMNR
jgi:hypothetical protein